MDDDDGGGERGDAGWRWAPLHERYRGESTWNNVLFEEVPSHMAAPILRWTGEALSHLKRSQFDDGPRQRVNNNLGRADAISWVNQGPNKGMRIASGEELRVVDVRPTPVSLDRCR